MEDLFTVAQGNVKCELFREVHEPSTHPPFSLQQEVLSSRLRKMPVVLVEKWKKAQYSRCERHNESMKILC